MRLFCFHYTRINIVIVPGRNKENASHAATWQPFSRLWDRSLAMGWRTNLQKWHSRRPRDNDLVRVHPGAARPTRVRPQPVQGGRKLCVRSLREKRWVRGRNRRNPISGQSPTQSSASPLSGGKLQDNTLWRKVIILVSFRFIFLVSLF